MSQEDTEPMERDTPFRERPTLKIPTLRSSEMLLGDALSDCRNDHAQLKADEVRWSALPRTGYVYGVDGDGDIEQRKCHCGSVVAKELGR
jgi:hypothetical protein